MRSAVSAFGDFKPERSRLNGAAYWAMMRRVVLVAACVDAAWIALYAALGSLPLALLNVVSVAMYVASYWLIGQRRNLAAVSLVSLEVLAHSAIGSLLIGWESGFHYFLLLFIPALVVGSARRYAIPLLAVLLALYLGLETLCAAQGPISPLPADNVRTARWINIALVFGLFYALASFYRNAVLKAERRLLEQATTDPLTGLANRSHFHAQAATELSRSNRNGAPIGLILADIDSFKRVNDESGHQTGDEVLVRVARILQANLRDIDLLARWGGEEFLALLPGSDLAMTSAVAERARHAIESTPFEVDGRLVRITMSFGVSETNSVEDMHLAIARADKALYASKESGRNYASLQHLRDQQTA
jgi:diguanylate cyclase (GGDEF)-like protein